MILRKSGNEGHKKKSDVIITLFFMAGIATNYEFITHNS